MPTDLTSVLAANLAAGRARTYLAERHHQGRSQGDGEWRNGDVLEAFLAVVNRVEVIIVGPRTVTASTPATHNGHVWSYVAGDALTAALHADGTGGTVARTDTHTFTLTLTP